MMLKFGEVLFRGSRFVFWALSPFLAFLVVGMPLLVDGWWPWSNILVFALDAIAILLLFALYDVKRFWWAARGVTGIVFLAVFVFLIDDIRGGKPWRFDPRSEKSIVEALLAVFFIGWPSLRYTISGRFGSGHHQTADRPPNLSTPCPNCGEPMRDHAWTLFASTVVSKKNLARLKDFEARVRSHDWVSLKSFSEWEGTKDNLDAFILRCRSGGAVLVYLDPFELYGPQLRSAGRIAPEEMSAIENIVGSSGWSSAPAWFLKDRSSPGP